LGDAQLCDGPAFVAAAAALIIPTGSRSLYHQPAVVDVAAHYLRIGALADHRLCEIVLEGAWRSRITVPPADFHRAHSAAHSLAWWAAGRWGGWHLVVDLPDRGGWYCHDDPLARGRLEAQIRVAQRPIITLLTDFGRPTAIAELKGVLFSLAPESRSSISRTRFRRRMSVGALAVARYWRRFPAGPYIVVVDRRRLGPQCARREQRRSIPRGA
jgi:hypothetical protein